MTRRKPILGGRTYMRVGSILTGKIVIYPIIDSVDAEGNQLINWMAEIKRDTAEQNDWNKPGNLSDFFPLYESWRFDWLDVAQMIRDADQILEYPMVDKDPIDRWTFGRVTLAGDAAHPMYPRGSNGAAQAAIDARTLADLLQENSDGRTALKAYEAARAAPAAKVATTSTNTSRKMNCARCRRTTSGLPVSHSPTWRARLRADSGHSSSGQGLSGDNALRNCALGIRMTPSNGLLRSRIRNIEPETESAHSSKINPTSMLGRDRRPKTANMTVSQNTKIVKNGIETVSPLCT